jgi:hypothetical protein
VAQQNGEFRPDLCSASRIAPHEGHQGRHLIRRILFCDVAQQHVHVDRQRIQLDETDSWERWALV